MIKFVTPQLQHEKLAQEYIEEHRRYGEYTLHGSALLDSERSYDQWVGMIHGNRCRETVTEGWVSASTYFVMDEEEREIIGMVDIRHELNEFLRSYGGHIGYGVRPSKRRQGYASLILRKALQYCKLLHIQEVMISCSADNEGSRRTILSCGGQLEKELTKDGQPYQIYWIRLPAVKLCEMDASAKKHILQTSFYSQMPLRLKNFQGKEKKKRVVLERIIEEFAYEELFTEKEVTQILSSIYDDAALLRRYLIIYGYMQRKKDGSCYWRT